MPCALRGVMSSSTRCRRLLLLLWGGEDEIARVRRLVATAEAPGSVPVPVPPIACRELLFQSICLFSIQSCSNRCVDRATERETGRGDSGRRGGNAKSGEICFFAVSKIFEDARLFLDETRASVRRCVRCGGRSQVEGNKKQNSLVYVTNPCFDYSWLSCF